MNVLRSIREYKSLSQRYRDLYSDFNKNKDKLKSEICDKVEKLTQQESFIEFFFDSLVEDKYTNRIAEFVYEINTMMVAIHKKKYQMAYDTMSDSYDYNHQFDRDLMPFIPEDLAFEIREYMSDIRMDNGYCDFYTYYTLKIGTKKFDIIYPIAEDKELDYEDGTFTRVYNLDPRYERAVKAYYDMILKNSDRVLSMLEDWLENYS